LILSAKTTVSNCVIPASNKSTLKDLFRDVFQEMLEAELDEHLGFCKYTILEKDTNNSRNGYSKKNLKTGFGM